MQGRGLLALAIAAIAALVVALLFDSRGSGPRSEPVARPGEPTTAGQAEACTKAVTRAMASAADRLDNNFTRAQQDELRALTIGRCRDDAWSTTVTDCLVEATAGGQMEGCIAMLTSEQRQRFTEVVERVAKQPDPPVVDTAPDDPNGGGLPASCVEYGRVIERYTGCAQIPQASRDALRDAYRSMEQGWGSMSGIDGTARQAMNDACKQGADALRQAFATMCP